ncbi:MAG: outer membrane protein transport protein [Candidatus Aminicenantes bacterium]|nr:outer membrane protein transport protein [Candidatus Aminicenantes bacterium]
MKKTKTLLAVLTCLIFLSSFGFSNGLNLNGLGARMVAMGGAFVGLADDFTAALWNPAGLAQLNATTFGLSGDLIIPNGTYQLGLLGIDAKTESKMYPAGILGFFTPVGDKIVAGISIHTPSGLGASWNGADLALLSGVSPLLGGTGNPNMVWESFIGQIAISPAIAVKISDNFSLGATLNINYGIFNIERTAGAALILHPQAGLMFVDLGQYTEKSKGWGFGATIGALVKPIEQLSIGVSFRTPSKVKFDGDASIENFPSLGAPEASTFTREVISPMWLGIGIAFNPAENITITADGHYTNWGKLDTVATEYSDLFWQAALADEADLELMWEDKWQFRFGVEYWVSETLAVRAGYYNDPTPSPDTTLNVLVPGFDFNAITGGIGLVMNNFSIDVSAEYLFGKERDIALDGINEMPGVYGMNILSVTASLIYEWAK